jgi:hypothetical protein
MNYQIVELPNFEIDTPCIHAEWADGDLLCGKKTRFEKRDNAHPTCPRCRVYGEILKKPSDCVKLI